MNTLESLMALAFGITLCQFVWLEITWNRKPRRK